jgi:hypothetical protein
LESEKREVIKMYKKQVEAYQQIKRYIEHAKWDDDRYDKLIDSLNIIGGALSNALHKLTNGDEVYVIDDLVWAAQKYLENKDKFPQI